MLPQISGRARSYDETNSMKFLIDGQLLRKHNKVRNKVSINTKKEFDSEPIYNEKYLRTKIKSYEGKTTTNFHDGGIPNKSSHYICLSVILMILFLNRQKQLSTSAFRID